MVHDCGLESRVRHGAQEAAALLLHSLRSQGLELQQTDRISDQVSRDTLLPADPLWLQAALERDIPTHGLSKSPNEVPMWLLNMAVEQIQCVRKEM